MSPPLCPYVPPAAAPAESLVQALFWDSPDACLVLDGGQIVSCNAAAGGLFGGDGSRLAGQSLLTLLPEFQPDQRRSEDVVAELFTQARQAGRAVGEVLARRWPDTEFWGELLVTPLSGTDATRCLARWRDVTECRIHKQKLRQLSQAVEQCPVTIVITDLAGRIEYVNRKFEAITGYTREEAVGLNPRVLKSGEQGPEVYRELWEAISSGREWRGELHNRRKNGELYWESVSISPIRRADGRITHYLAVKEDIESRKQAEYEIQQTNAALEAAIARTQEMTIKAEVASMAKSEFLARMSHEIRTPMNGVIGMTGLLLDTPLNETQRRFAEIVRSSADALLTVINDILDFSKIEAGKMDLELIEFDLREVVTGTAEILAPRAQTKGVEFVCDVASDLPAVLRGDPGRVRQIILNLAGNAIKFTERGEVVLRVRSTAAKAGRGCLRFEIMDTGIGIPAEKMAMLFTAFTQIDGSNTRRFGGTGLGLAIARQLAELMGGRVGATSTVGRGSMFWFEVELEAPGDLNGAPPPEIRPGFRVLVADDNETCRKLLVRWCAARGCEVTEAADGPTAIALLEQAAVQGRPIQLALIDLLIPRMDGLVLGRQVQPDASRHAVSLVWLTVPGATPPRIDTAGGSWQETLSKPVMEQTLRDCLARAAVRHGEVVAVAKAPLPAPVRPAAFRRGRVLVAEDNVTNQMVAVGVLRKLGLEADVVANGVEAIRRLATTPYDLVLMDCQMPEMNGYEATTCIRLGNSNVLNHRIPIIAMTADAMTGVREECLAAGMDDYVAKPISVRSVAAVLEKWLPAPVN